MLNSMWNVAHFAVVIKREFNYRTNVTIEKTWFCGLRSARLPIPMRNSSPRNI